MLELGIKQILPVGEDFGSFQWLPLYRDRGDAPRCNKDLVREKEEEDKGV